MATVTVICSRCGATVEGLWDEDLTAGFYDVSAGPWAAYARPGETILCDACMHANPGYQEVYGAPSEVDHG